MSKSTAEKFAESLSEPLQVLNSLTQEPDVNQLFDQFLKIFSQTVNNHASLKLASRKEKRIKSKPWLTQDILKSINKKNQLFQNFLKTKDNEKIHAEYKSYRNLLNQTIDKAKSNYYNKVL